MCNVTKWDDKTIFDKINVGKLTIDNPNYEDAKYQAYSNVR